MESCTAATMRMMSAPNPTPASPANTRAFLSSSGWTVASPAIPPEKMRKPAESGSLTLLKRLPKKPQTGVDTRQAIQNGSPRATTKNGSGSNKERVLYALVTCEYTGILTKTLTRSDRRQRMRRVRCPRQRSATRRWRKFDPYHSPHGKGHGGGTLSTSLSIHTRQSRRG